MLANAFVNDQRARDVLRAPKTRLVTNESCLIHQNKARDSKIGQFHTKLCVKIKVGLQRIWQIMSYRFVIFSINYLLHFNM